MVVLGAKVVVGFPIKDARLVKYEKSIFHIIYLPYHHGVDLEYFLVLRNPVSKDNHSPPKKIFSIKIKYRRN